MSVERRKLLLVCYRLFSLLCDCNLPTLKLFCFYYSLGIFDRVEIRLSLRRHVYYYLVEYYFPLALVVATSWISFWIDYRCTAARATLPVTTFLTLTTMAETLRAKDAGSLSHSTMFEIYINVCTFYVFAVLIEYAIIEATCQFPKVRTS